MTTTNSVYGVNTYAGSSKLNQSSHNTSLNMQDFLQLLVAQLTNQNVLEPMDNTDFIAQMAQFTMLQSIETLSQVGNTQYAASLIGKNVIVAAYDSTGKYMQDQGLVECVNLFDEQPSIIVNGKQYNLASVMQIVNETASQPEEQASAQ
ncbi:MAG: flagellar hook capping FlgD N-terminal domain-containing protein [Clostridia bacterium]|nr:flagellar hook capping FlgD N-terminal domain-containing protein [Clostridia bacterium]